VRRLRKKKPKGTWKGLAAGATGGLVASYAMSLFHSAWAKLVQPPTTEGPDSTVRTANAITCALVHHDLTAGQQRIAGPLVHYLFGTAVGAVYGSGVELLPAVSTGFGLPFGTAVWLGADVTAVPALGLSGSPPNRPLADKAGEFAAHLVYGAVTDAVRHLLRRHLDRL
jgi:uncharacterized membrane protein YagU involved in acid resistance